MSQKLDKVDQELQQGEMNKVLVRLVVVVFRMVLLSSLDCVCIYNGFNTHVLIMVVFTMTLLSEYWSWLYLQWFQHPRADCACNWNDPVINKLFLVVFAMISSYKLWLCLHLQWLKHTLYRKTKKSIWKAIVSDGKYWKHIVNQ